MASELKYYINSIYSGTEGEGAHIGRPQIFVRFQGCNIGCVNCDSKETWDFQLSPPQTLEQVLAVIEQISTKGLYPLKRISITGGDPLHPLHERAVLTLAQVLKDRGFYLNIEASGARVVPTIFDVVDFISFDYKTPSTAVRTPLKWIPYLAEHYPTKFQVKSVITDDRDFEATWTAYEEVKQTSRSMDFDWCLTPAFTPGEEFSFTNFISMQKKNEERGAPFRVIGQQHKWIYGPDEKQV